MCWFGDRRAKKLGEGVKGRGININRQLRERGRGVEGKRSKRDGRNERVQRFLLKVTVAKLLE